MAGPADFHQHIASQFGVSDDLPCADLALLTPLQSSPEYRAISQRVANPKPVDAWQEDGLHFFVFELLRVDGAGVVPPVAEAPVAVFTMHPEETAPISAVVVTPSASGEDAEVVNLREPDTTYTAPLLSDGHPANNGDTLRESAPEAPIGAAPIDSGEPPGAETASTASEDRANDYHLMADIGLLVSLKESPEYQALGQHLASPEPVDSWQEDGLHFFVFELLRVDGAGAVPPAAEAPVVIFTMHPEETVPVSAVAVTPIPGGEHAEVVDLRQPDSGYTAPFAPWRRQ